MTVLLIEDDDDLRATMAEILVEQGHRVTAIGTIDDARKYLAAFLPTLIVLDGRLCGQSARSLLLEIDLRYPDARPAVLLVSGSWGSAELADEFSLPYLPKPFDLDRFVGLVRRLCGSSGSGERRIPLPIGLASAVATEPPRLAVGQTGRRQ